MSAETLRKAASLMRERAEAATPGPWEGYYDDSSLPHWVVITAKTGDQVASHVMDRSGYEERHGLEGADAYHIASWHPDVALAVAGWLDRCAVIVESYENIDQVPVMSPDALAVARAYLGGAA